MRLLTALVLPVFLAACAGNTGYRHPTGFTPLPGIEAVTLNAPLTIRADRASEYIQDGRVQTYWDVSLYYTHCKFELRTVSEAARTVQPDTFTVTGTRRERYMAGFVRMMVAGAGGDYNPVVSTTVLTLQSDRQPDVFRLSCEIMDEPYLARHVSVGQMRKALGGLFTLGPQ